MRRCLARIAFCLIGLAMIGCSPPSSFVRTMEPTWASVEIRTDLPYEKAWESLVDILVRRFDLEVISREDGYVRSAWLYSWTGTLMENYRVRVTAKFSPGQEKVDIKAEAEYGGPGNWVIGTDTRLLETLKSDIMGTIGRTTR